jgi:hypothetical protein
MSSEVPADPFFRALATELEEHNPLVLEQLDSLVRVLGPEPCRQLADAAKIIESAGGMLKNRGGRRSFGGTFFFLASQHPVGSTVIKRRKPFRGDAPSAAPVPRYPAIRWQDRLTAIAVEPRGELRTVKITVTGRPGQITRADGFVAMVLSQRAVPSLPKGLPVPPPEPTDYMVFVSEKHWRKVEKALEAPNDFLIVEGWCAFDGEAEKIAVWGTNVTTRELQRAARPA